MPLYKYEAKNMDGKKLKGKLNIDNEEELRRKLKSKGYFLISYENEESLINLNLNVFYKVSQKDLSILCRELYFSFSSGINILESISIVKNQVENKKLENILENVFKEVEKGKMLSDAFSKFKDIPKLFIDMIKVGEATGRLDEIMKDLADYYDKQYKQERKVKNALIYPKFLISFSLLIVAVLVAYVVPIFVENLLSANQKLPIPTRIVISLSSFIKNEILLILILILVIFLIKRFILDKNKAYIFFRDKLKLKVKVLGTVSRQIMTARFARTFSILFAGGISVIDCMEISANVVENEYAKNKLLRCRDLIDNGSTIGDALATLDIFPKMLVQSIRVGEESGSVDKTLKKASSFYDSEANFALEKITNLIEPVMIIILALVVGFVVLSLVLPMFSMYQAVQ
ncbi:MAG: type II secretion system F family protein [Clostridium baratii]|uniref:Type II secretion system (T2SS), F family protein n=1 Tax=Clostridium baratii str. Sullivan TaxID=1415775 RepID=A0A0A7FWK3_9CLOT|nr:type II secretion system F family protein [Clostridium baratii]AIY83211.1 type II secretion system (T2SS), F family protein [Clostridium baratii str. Sullivan]MBS6006058.1 type II secretion system F family protein [Clostridium baratii]